jgi:hypothetical protein
MWRLALIGGAGGLAPFACQVLALFLPNLVGGWDRYPQSLGLLPQTSGQWMVLILVLIVVFAIAAGVVYATLDGSANETMAKAFLIGVSVPAMILSLANGTANGAKNTSTVATNSHMAPQSEHAYTFASWSVDQPARPFVAADVRLAGIIAKGSVRLSLQCPSCPPSIRPVYLVQVRPGAGPMKTISLSLDKPSEMPVAIEGPAQNVVVSLPGPPTNSSIQQAAQVSYVAKDGETWLVNIVVSPGAWNNVRAFLAVPPYFTVESMTAVRASAGSGA